MTYASAVFLGFIQGVAEFLPISSSGHLSLLQYFMGLTDIEHDHLFFDILLHFGTLVSVCIAYRADIAEMIFEFFRGIQALFSRQEGRPPYAPPARRLVMMLILGTLPLLIIVPLKGQMEKLYSNPVFIGCALLLTGFILFFSDYVARGRKTERTATVTDTLLVGCAQALAVIPGLSRSGATISAGMLRGFDRRFAVRFSFLLSLPAILGANVLSLIDAVQGGFDTSLLPMYLTGVVVAMLSGLLAITLVRFLSDKGKFGSFAYYCWAVGALSIVAAIVLP